MVSPVPAERGLFIDNEFVVARGGGCLESFDKSVWLGLDGVPEPSGAAVPG